MIKISNKGIQMSMVIIAAIVIGLLTFIILVASSGKVFDYLIVMVGGLMDWIKNTFGLLGIVDDFLGIFQFGG